MRICFCHHLSLAYYGGGEKWLISTTKELVKRGHNVEIYALPFLLNGKPKVNPKKLLDDIPYTEGRRHKIKADVVYITYHPLSWINFQTSKPRIAGLHSHTYWQKPHLRYGTLPNIANLTNRFISYFELRRFNAIHSVTNVYPINHPRVYHIPNFVDSEKYYPCLPKEEVFTIAYASRKVWQKGWYLFKEVEKNLSVKSQVSGSIREENMPSFFSKAHATLVPSIVDTFGLSIVESLLCETPVITTPLTTHEALGLPLIYASTLREYMGAIVFLQKNWEEGDFYRSFSKFCRLEAMKYDKTIIMDKLENMFKEVLSLGGEQ